MRHALPVSLALLLSGASPFQPSPPHGRSSTAAPPNLVVFMIDDLGWQDLSVPMHTERTAFNDRYRTPNLERLAARGLRFTQAYAAAPVCTPTRTSFLTGRSPARNRITYWTLRADEDQSAAFEGLQPPEWNVNALQEGDVTLPRLLRDKGYHTIHAGKAHFGAKGTSGEDPTRLGFDVNIAGHAAGGPGSFLGTQDFSAVHRGGSDVWDVPGLEAYHGKDVYLTEALTVEAKKALRAAVEEEKPFFLHFAPYAVHAPITANERYLDRYAELDPREAAYATMIETVDAAVGAILDEIETLGLTEETIVVFTSDNGGLSAHARGGEPHVHNAPLRSGKGSAYEGGVRIPQIVAWPGVTDSGGTCDVPVITMDLFPTILGWAGARAPADHAATVDGADLASLLRGEGPESFTERSLFWHQPHFWGVNGPGIFPYSAVRHADWKLVYRHGDRGFELYDLANDLGETRERSAERPELVRDLAERLSLLCEAAGAQMSIDTETGEPVALPREHVSAKASGG